MRGPRRATHTLVAMNQTRGQDGASEQGGGRGGQGGSGGPGGREGAKPGVKAPTQPPTGLRDLYPADLNRLRYIQDAWRRVSINHGFEEIDGPTFEDADLYAVKSGEGILNEVFGVFSGKSPEERARLGAGGNAPFALRPEFTPTLARMYAARAGALAKPTKWFWTQNCFRAERPQRGRLREFYQWNCDIIGLESTDPEAEARADAECIATCVGLLESLGLSANSVKVGFSDRLVLQGLLAMADVSPENTSEALALLDRKGKGTTAEFESHAKTVGLSVDLWYNNMEKLGGALRQGELRIMDTRGRAVSLERLHSLKRQLAIAGLRDWCVFDESIVRGLAYYTGMVFEVHEVSGAERAIAGGGRYDGLIELFGGPPTPAVGFGMGDVVLSNLLVDKGLMPSDDEIAARLGQRPDVVVISNGTPEADAQVGPMLAALRAPTPGSGGRDRFGLHARRSYKTTKNVGKLIQDAAKMRARFCLIIESATQAQLKDMDTGTQVAVDVGNVGELRRALL